MTLDQDNKIDVMTHSGHHSLCEVEIPYYYVTPKERYGPDIFFLSSDLELIHMTLGQGHGTPLSPTNIITGEKNIFFSEHLSDLLRREPVSLFV